MTLSARRLAAIALGTAALSVALNLYLLAQLRNPERWAVPAAERALLRLTGGDSVITQIVRIPAGTPLHLDVPVDERFGIAVDTVLPIDTQVRVPLETPFGDRFVNVPIRARVPLRGTVPLHVRHTFRLRTQTPRDIEVPVQLRIGDLLDRARAPS